MTLDVRVVGSGPDIVFLHGWGLHRAIWDGVVADLATRYRLHLVDLPGHGHSPWDSNIRDLDDLADRIAHSIPQASTLIGWSLGGFVAQRLARLRPETIQALVLIASTPKFVAGHDWACGMEPSVLDNFAARLRTDYLKTVEEFLALQVRGQERALATLRELKARMLDGPLPDVHALETTLDILRNSDTRDELTWITQPTLVFAGEYDRLTPPAAGRYLADRIPISEFELVLRAAHAPFLSHKESFVARLLHFLDRSGASTLTRQEA